jgi:hypothetical protein
MTFEKLLEEEKVKISIDYYQDKINNYVPTFGIFEDYYYKWLELRDFWEEQLEEMKKHD